MKPNPHIADASVDERLREVLFVASGGISNMANDEIATIKDFLVQGLIAKIPEKKFIDAYYDEMTADQWKDYGYNQALSEVKQQILEYFGVKLP